ncbi:MAG: tetratricopeptide repeat protein [Flavobacteriaceae bacterium]|nr:tetratricopeptide repeat protein [Flavobacteriaceae bacterium]
MGCLFLGQGLLHAQDTSIEFLKSINDSVKKYSISNPKKALTFSLQVLEKQNNWEPSQQLINIYYNTSKALQSTNLDSQAIFYLNRSIELFQATPVSKRKNKHTLLPPWIILDIGNIYLKNNKPIEAEANYLIALENFQRLKNPILKNQGLATTFDNLALLSLQDKNFKRADSFYQQSLILRIKSKKVEDILYSQVGLMSLQLLQDNELEAQKYFSQIQETYLQNKKLDSKGIVTSNIARYNGQAQILYFVYLCKKEFYEQAIPYLDRAAVLLEYFKSDFFQVQLYRAMNLVSLEKLDEAEAYIKGIIKETVYPMEIYKLLETIYEQQKKIPELLSVKDSIIQLQKEDENSILPALKELETGLLLYNKQQEISKEERRANTFFLFLIIAIVTLIASFILLRMNYLLQKKKATVAEFENEIAQRSLKTKKMELVNKSNFIIQRNQHLNGLLTLVNKTETDHEENLKLINKVNRVVKNILKSETVYSQFEAQFQEVYPEFFKILVTKHGKLTSTDIQLCCYIKMNQTSKIIAQLTGVSVRTVEGQKYRLKKKFLLDKDLDLVTYIHSI